MTFISRATVSRPALFAALGLLIGGAWLPSPVRADDAADALVAESGGKWAEAVSLWRGVVQGEAGARSPETRMHLRRYLGALAAVGDYAKLDVEAQNALSRFPGWDEAAIARARALEAVGRPADGAELLKDAAAGSYPAAVERARLLAVTGKHEAAESILSDVVHAYSPSEAYDPRELLAFGRAAAARGDYQGAARVMQVAYEDSTDYLEARIALATLFQEKYQARLAGDELAAAGKIAPRHPDVLLCAARLAVLNQQLSRADEGARQVLAIRPGDAGASAVLARIHLWELNPEAAMAALEAPLQADPTDRELRSLAAAAYYLQGDSTAYRREVKRVLDQDPAYYDVYMDLGGALEANRRNFEAIGIYRRVLALDPGNPAALIGIGLLYMREGDETSARTYLEQGFDGDPFNIRAYNQLQLLDKMDTFASERTAHFDLRIDDTDTLLAPLLESRLDSIYVQLTGLHGWKPRVPTVVEVFPTHEWFSARVTGFPWVEGIPAVCFGDVIAMDSPRTLAGHSNWNQILRHEFGHVLALGMTGKKVPFWFTEGLSVHLEQYPRGEDWDQNLRGAYVDRELVPVDSLTLAFTRPKAFRQRLLAYHEAGLIIDDIVSTKGWDSIPRLLKAFGAGKTLAEAVKDVLGESYETFSAHALDVVRKEAESLEVWPAPSRDRLERLEAEAKAGRSDRELLESLALTQLQLGKDDDAETTAKQLLAADPGNVRALGVLGLAEKDPKRKSDALAHLEAAAAGDTRDAPVYLALASLHLAAGDTAAALADNQKALDIYPLALTALSARAKLFGARGDTGAARQEYGKLLSRTDRAGDGAVALARLELAADRPEAASRALEYAVDVVPLNADVEALRGQAYLLLGEDRRAFDLFTRARKLDIRSVESMVGMARYYLKRGDSEEAAYFAELALKYQPDHPVAKQVLASAQAW